MRCPRCGCEMTLDVHRKIPLNMCYECGYIEGRTSDDDEVYSSGSAETNYSHIKTLNFNEQVVFLSRGLGLEEEQVRNFLESPFRTA